MSTEFRLLKSEVVPLTPVLAAEWRDLTPSPTERELNPHRMKHLREKAAARQLVTFHWAKALFDGKPIRVNGQHSATMLCELDGNFPANLMAHIDEYQVDTIDGLAMLFRQFDDRTSSRSPSDIAGAYQNLCPALREVKKPIGKLGIQGAVWYRRHVLGDPAVPSGDDRYFLFNEVPLQQFLVWLDSILGIKTPELKREPVVAAIYATFIANEREARPFWETVARGGTDYDEDEPTTVLDTWLKETKEERGAEKIPPAKFYQSCIYAWNAAREHKQIKAIKVDTKKAWLTPHAD